MDPTDIYDPTSGLFLPVDSYDDTSAPSSYPTDINNIDGNLGESFTPGDPGSIYDTSSGGALDQQGSGATPQNGGSSLSSLAALFGAGASVYGTAVRAQGVNGLISAQQSALTASSPLQSLGITDATGSLTSTGMMLLLAGAALIAFSVLKR